MLIIHTYLGYTTWWYYLSIILSEVILASCVQFLQSCMHDCENVAYMLQESLKHLMKCTLTSLWVGKNWHPERKIRTRRPKRQLGRHIIVPLLSAILTRDTLQPNTSLYIIFFWENYKCEVIKENKRAR